MRTEDGWVYPENQEDLNALGLVQDGDEFVARGDDSYQPYVNSVGKRFGWNKRINPLASRRPLHKYQPVTAEGAHFL
jgi:hypothetical protein